MDEFDKLLLGKAGIKLPIDKASVPPNQNTEKLSDIEINRAGDKGTHKDIKVSRTGTKGDPHEIRIDRPGESGFPTTIESPRSGTAGKTYEFELFKHESNPQYQQIDSERSGTDGKLSKISVDRSGEEGRVADIKINRIGTPGSQEDLRVTRQGTAGSDTDIVTTRQGTDGKTTEVNTSRSGENGKFSEIKSERVGTTGTLLDLRFYRSGTKGKTTNISSPRTGINGVESDVEITRQSEDKSELTVTRPGVPDDTNPYGLNVANPKVRGLLGKTFEQLVHQDSDINKIAEAIDRNISNILGIHINFENYVQAEYWIKKIASKTVGKLLGPQASGLQAIMGFTPTNEDIMSYYKHLMMNEGDNLRRIPLDLAMRLVTIPSQLYAKKLLRVLFTGEEVAPPMGGTAGKGINKAVTKGLSKLGIKNLRDLQFKLFDARHRLETNRTPSISEAVHSDVKSGESFDSSDHEYADDATFLGYKISSGKLIETTRLISSVLERHGFYEATHNRLTEAFRPGGDEETYFQGSRGLWQTSDGTSYEMADNFYWGCRVHPYIGYECLLPKFPEEFRQGWWPVLSLSYTKSSLISKSFQVPFFNLEIPISTERPSKMRMTLLDNSKRSFQYWLEDYVDKCFDIDNNIILPYKNILLHVTVYRYDMTLSKLYQGDYLGLISTHNLAFNGENSHNANEIDLNLEIVGEYPANFERVIEKEIVGKTFK